LDSISVEIIFIVIKSSYFFYFINLSYQIDHLKYEKLFKFFLF